MTCADCPKTNSGEPGSPLKRLIISCCQRQLRRGRLIPPLGRLGNQAAAQGLGVALESTTTGSLHLADGKLHAVLSMDKSIRVKAHFAVYPARHAKRPPVAAFLAWLHHEAQASSSLPPRAKRN